MTVSAQQPELSIVVVVVSDTVEKPDGSRLAGCLQALRQLENPPQLEILVPHTADTTGLEEVRKRYPEVRFQAVADLQARRGESGSREHHDELRARGIALARGSMVALLEDHGRPAESWAAEMAAALGKGYAAAGGPIENGVPMALNEAVYLCDFYRYQNPIEEGPAAVVSDANVVYRRESLDAVADVWQDFFREPFVNAALQARGEALGMTPKAIVYQHREGLTLGVATRERFIWGRSFAATRRKAMGRGRALLFALLSPVLLMLLPTRIILSVLRKGRAGQLLLKAIVPVIWLSAAWAAGEFAGYVAGEQVA